jgi:hypothetical protein
MHFMYPSILFAATAMATSFTIPPNQIDGVYEVSFDHSGRPTHTFLREITNTTEPHHLTTRDDGSYCGNYNLDPLSTDRAVAALKAQCNPGAVGNGLDFYSISGSTVAYFCNFGAAATVCQSGEIGDSYARVTNACGRYRAGWRSIHDSGRWISIGYEASNARFCGRGP